MPYVHVLEKLLDINVQYLKSPCMTVVFRALFAKSKIFHFFAFISNFKCKYSKSNIYCE